MLPLGEVVRGNCLEVMRGWPAESVDLVMFSPPYWGLRCYGKETETEWSNGWKGELGLEPHPLMYVEHLVLICRELKRVLKKTGSMYIVLGDTFAGSLQGYGAKGKTTGFQECAGIEGSRFGTKKPPQSIKSSEVWIRPKQQLNMPFHVAFALQQDGWIQRDRAIWHKPNSMPASVKDRLACSYEFIFHFVKNDVTCLWRNMETGEWRNSRPVQQYVKETSGLRVVSTERPTVLRKLLSECSELEREERKKWRRMWMGFDYYYDLDSIREFPKSLKTFSTTKSMSKSSPSSLHLCNELLAAVSTLNDSTEWTNERLAIIKNELLSALDTNTSGKGWAPFNLRVRDVKRGKGGVSAFGTLKASPQEIEGYAYPESFQAKKEPYLRNNPHRMRLERERHLALNPERPDDLSHPKGKNPRDIFRDKTEDEGFKGPLTARQAPEPSEPNAFHPLGKNPSDVFKFSEGKYAKDPEVVGSPRARTSREGYDAESHFYYDKGKNPGDCLEAPEKISHFDIFPFQSDSIAVSVDEFRDLEDFSSVIIDKLKNSSTAMGFNISEANTTSLSKKLSYAFQKAFSSSPIQPNLVMLRGHPYSTITIEKSSNKMRFIFGSHWWEIKLEGFPSPNTEQSKVSSHSFAVNLDFVSMPIPSWAFFFSNWTIGSPSLLNKLDNFSILRTKTNSSVCSNSVHQNNSISSHETENVSHFVAPLSKVEFIKRVFTLLCESIVQSEHSLILINIGQEHLYNFGDVTKIGTHHGSSLSAEGRATHTKGQLVEAHPLGANPSDIIKSHTVRHKSWMSTPGHPYTHKRRFPEGYFPSDFWSINTKPFKGAHFAVYPEAICVKPILSSCPPNDGIVLDPMAGSGTTCVVARKLGRKFIGIELNPSYVEIAKKRLADMEKSTDKKIGKSASLDSYLSR